MKKKTFNARPHRALNQKLKTVFDEGWGGLFRKIKFRVDFMGSKYFDVKSPEIYDAKFYAETRVNNQYMQFFSDEIYKNLKPKSLLDAGCGDGSLLFYFSRYPVVLFGLDGSEISIKQAAGDFLAMKCDLSRGFLINKTFDVVCSIETAEHLPPKRADIFVESLSKAASQYIVFSAAQPGQGGCFHINEQPKQYWLSKFQKRDWRLEEQFTNLLRSALIKANAPSYLEKNIFVLSRAG